MERIELDRARPSSGNGAATRNPLPMYGSTQVVPAGKPVSSAGRANSTAIADVVIVSDGAHVNGGNSQVALSSAIALARLGYRITVFAAAGPVMPELLATPNVRVVLTGQYEIAHDPSRLRAATQGIWNVSAARGLSQILAAMDGRRTIVHVHSWTKALSSSVVKVAVDRGFRVVVTLHDYFAVCPIGSLFNHQRGEICQLRPMGTGCLAANCDPRHYRDKVWRVARQVVQRSAGVMPRGIRHFITISDLSEALIAPQLPASAALYRVNNPIDVERRPAADVARNSAFMFVGRLSQEKGPALFARAAKAAGVEAVFLGAGECADEVRRCNPEAELGGWLPHARVLERLSQARALVFPSLWYENSPLAVAEAAALGVPAIVADTCAARERVIDGETGVCFRSGDVGDLAAALGRFTDDAFTARLGARAYDEYWKAPPDVDRHIRELVPVYEAMMRES